MSAVELELNDSTISTSQNHEGTKKHKKRKHKTLSDDEPADISMNTTTVDGMLSEEKRKHKKKKRDRSSENNDSIIEPSQNDTVEVKSKRQKSKSKEKPLKETEIEEDLEPENATPVEVKRKEKKKKRDRSSEKNDSVIEPSQIDVVERKRKRHKSQIEEEQPIQAENGPEQDKDSIIELTQESRRKRRKTNHDEEAPRETEKGSEKDSEFNGEEEGDNRILRRSRRKSVVENSEMNEQDQQKLLSRMLSILPECDGVSYLNRLEEFEWNDVIFGNFSVKNCQEQFNRIAAKIRKSRTLAEIIHDAKRSSKKMTTGRKVKPIAKRTAFQLYLKKKVDAYLQKHPGKSKREDATEKYRSKWAALSDEEKVKYIRKAEDHNAKFQEEVEEKCRNDPSYIPPKRLAILSKGEQKILDKIDGIPPRPPASGYLLFCEIMKERLKTEMPDISTQDFLVETGHRWRVLSEEKKEHYKRKSEKKKHKYLEFLEAHPEIEAKVNADKRIKTVVKKTAKRIFEGEPAKPPTSGYMILCKEILPTLTDVPGRDRMHEASKRWAALTEEKRTEYNEKMKAAMQIYYVELEAFKKKLSPEDLQQYEEIHKKASPKTPKKSPSSPSKEIAGKQKKNPPSDANKEVVRKRKKTASKKAKKKSYPMVVKLWSKSPIPNSKSVANNGRAGDDDDESNKGNTSDSQSEVF